MRKQRLDKVELGNGTLDWNYEQDPWWIVDGRPCWFVKKICPIVREREDGTKVREDYISYPERYYREDLDTYVEEPVFVIIREAPEKGKYRGLPIYPDIYRMPYHVFRNLPDRRIQGKPLIGKAVPIRMLVLHRQRTGEQARIENDEYWRLIKEAERKAAINVNRGKEVEVKKVRPKGPLHIKYRPRTVDEIKGNQPAKDAIKDAFNKEVIPKVYLITGPAGCGKTSIAYIIRDLLGCHKSAFNEFDASTDRGIDKLRKIKSDAELHPLVGEVSVIFFDECHGITGTAQESMLKMLETPPPHVYCILATTEPAKLKPTLQRRCHKIPVDFLTRADTVQLLTEVAEEEERKWMSAKVFGAIYKSSHGSPGNAVQLLDQVITLCPVDAPENVRMEKEQEAINIIESVTYSQGFVIDLCRTLANRKLTGEEKWEQCKVLLKDFKGNAESSRLAVMAYFEKILFNTNHPAVARTMATFNEPMINSGRSGLTLATYYACRDFTEDEKRAKK